MFSKTLSALVAVACLALAGTANAMIINGGFETGALAPWFQDRVISGGEDWNVTNSDANSGTFSATNTGNKEIRQNFTGVVTDTISELSFWAKHIGGGDALFVDLFYSDTTDTGFTVFVTLAEDWKMFDVTSNLVSGKTLTGFSIFGNSSGTDFTRTFFDDVQLTVRVPEPGALAIFGLGLAGLGFMRRRRFKA